MEPRDEYFLRTCFCVRKSRPIADDMIYGAPRRLSFARDNVAIRVSPNRNNRRDAKKISPSHFLLLLLLFLQGVIHVFSRRSIFLDGVSLYIRLHGHVPYRKVRGGINLI